MKRLVFCSILMIMVSMKSYSQTDTTKGISFEHNLSWQEVLQKARKENKYVFVDCYTTWCGPCKMMDKNVYPVDSVGLIMEEKFISVRIQMDITAQDNDEIRQWYQTARAFEKEYHIGAYPEYLFFSPNGQIVHKDIGGKNINDFLSMARAAMDPQQQYYTLLDQYRNGNIHYSLMPILANAAQRMGQDSLSKELAHEYIHSYLETLPAEELWNKDNIIFLHRNSECFGLNDTIFQMYYRGRSTINSIFHDGHFSDGLINYILFRDEIRPMVDKALKVTVEPNWNRLEMTISNNYGPVYAKNNVLEGRIEYYRSNKQFGKYVKYFIREQEINGIESWKAVGARTLDLNNKAYEVFKYATNKWELEKALSWVNRALTADFNPEFIDTKANLLYKLGKRTEGLTLEEKSYTMAPGARGIADNYEKMKKGLPTWSTE